MFKLLLLSSLFMSVALPLRAARLGSPRHAFRRAVFTVVGFNVAWWVVVLLIVFIGIKNRDPNLILTHGVPG